MRALNQKLEATTGNDPEDSHYLLTVYAVEPEEQS